MDFFCFYFLFIFCFNNIYCRKKKYKFLLFSLLFGGFFISYLISGGEVISNKFVIFTYISDKKELELFLDLILINYNITLSSDLKQHLLINTSNKFDLIKKLNDLYLYSKIKGLDLITLEIYQNEFISKFTFYFYIYFILIVMCFFICLFFYINKIRLISKFEKLLTDHYNESYIKFPDSNINYLEYNQIVKYKHFKYRNYLVEEYIIRLIANRELSNKYGKIYRNQHSKDNYEFRLPFHLEFIDYLNLTNTLKKYKYLNIILFDNKIKITDIYILIINEIFNIQKKNKIYFSFVYEGFCLNEHESLDTTYVYDILLCVDLENSIFIKNTINKILLQENINYNIEYLENVNDFFNRKLYYKLTNKEENFHTGQDFFFFKYNFDLYKFYIMGEYMLQLATNKKRLTNNIENIRFNELSRSLKIFYIFCKSYNLRRLIPSFSIKYIYSYRFLISNKKCEINFDNNIYIIIIKINFLYLKIYSFRFQNTDKHIIIKYINLLYPLIENTIRLLNSNKLVVVEDIKSELVYLYFIKYYLNNAIETYNTELKNSLNKLFTLSDELISILIEKMSNSE